MTKLNKKRTDDLERSIYTASQGKLIFLKFAHHKLAIIGTIILIIFYGVAIFANFFAFNDPQKYFDDYSNAPPMQIRISDQDGLSRPFYYGYTKERNKKTLQLEYRTDTSKKHYLTLFGKGYDYKFLGMNFDRHFIAAEDGTPFYLFGTDSLGRDVLSRIMYGARISLTIGLVGVIISFIMGCVLGGISGYYGGMVDTVIQRIIEFLLSIPTLPLWMALSAALPRNWTMMQTYFCITIILSITSWTGLARVVRGKIISIKGEDYVTAARLSGAGDMNIIVKHLLPSFLGYLIVNLTISIPNMILGETSLSFLGLGLQSPAISWGVLLSDAQNIRTIAMCPWIMIPGIFVVIVVLAFNFVGDGLRDAADPYSENK